MNKKATRVIAVIFSVFFVLNYACQKPANPEQPLEEPPPVTQGSPQLPATPFDYTSEGAMPEHIRNYLAAHPDVNNTPADNPITNHGATLGRVLFYDKSLSQNNQTACASCHHQEKAFTDGLALSKGFRNGVTRRNAMPVFNLKYFKGKTMFWDLRAATLEHQVLMPITDPIEMGTSSLAALETKLKSISYYPELFKKAFGTVDITADRVSKALAQFLRSVTSFNSKYDQGLANGFANFTPQEIRGKQLVAQLNCIECHSDLTNVRMPDNPDPKPTFLLVENTGENAFGIGTNNGLDATYSDNGIGERTGLARDMGTFKMPSLRNIELTAPYMHDGRFASLEQVMDHYQAGVKSHPNRGVQIPPNGYSFLTSADKSAIVSFLKTLTDRTLTTEGKFADPFRQ
jgi:cytochrome c peroxidase